MPAPKTKRRAAGTDGSAPITVVPGSAGCLCGQLEHTEWATAPPARIAFNLDVLKTAWTGFLKPGSAARKSFLQFALKDVLVQTIEAAELPIEVATTLAMKYMQNNSFMDAARDFFEQLLDGQCVFLPSPGQAANTLPVARMPDSVVQIICSLVGDGQLLARFGGCVPAGYQIISSREGLLRFPSQVIDTDEGADQLELAQDKGICRPEAGIHYRPWSAPTEIQQYRDLISCCKLLAGLLLVLQRRLYKAYTRAQLVQSLATKLGTQAQAQAPGTTYQTFAWGMGAHGQLGLGPTPQAQAPTPIPGLADRQVVQVTAAGHHAMARTAQGELFSWGSSPYGVTGLHDVESCRVPLSCTAIPFSPAGLPNPVLQVSTGPLHTAVLVDNQIGYVYSWGAAWLGQLGNTKNLMQGGCLIPYDPATTSNLTSLSPGVSVPGAYIQALLPPGMQLPPAAAGERQPVCMSGLTAQPAEFGPFIDPDNSDSLIPGRQLQGAISVSAGALHTLCLTADGRVLTWGSNEADSLGLDDLKEHEGQPWVQAMGCACCDGKDSMVMSISSPNEVDLRGVVEGQVIQIAAGHFINAALTDKGQVATWGAAGVTPQLVKLGQDSEPARCIATGGAYAMAAGYNTGRVWTWVRHHMSDWDPSCDTDMDYQAIAEPWAPQLVPFLAGVHMLACSPTFGMAATVDGRVMLWPHAAVPAAAQQPTVALQQFEVASLRGLHVLSMAVGDDFAVVSTGPRPTLPPLPIESSSVPANKSNAANDQETSKETANGIQ